MQNLLALIVTFFLAISSFAQLKISANKKHLLTSNGKPFFWLADTAWELFHRLNREEAKEYLQNRSDKGFTVIQAVILAELDGLQTPNPYGDLPLIDNDPSKPNEAYFKHVDFIINEAAKRGLIMALLPSWGDKWNKSTWGTGPEVFTPQNAETFGEYVGARYKNKPVVWVMGGDRNLVDAEDYAIIRNMAKGIKKGDEGKHLITFHPQGSRSSFEFFAGDEWIDFHMSQTGHKVASPTYKWNEKAAGLKILKPHVNGEPNYEDHPNDFNPSEKGWMDDFDTRQAAYWNMLSGGAGHTYGNHNIWQFYSPARTPINNARTYWRFAMNHPGAFQVGFMKKFLEKLEWQKLQPDQSIISGDNPEGVEYKVAAISTDQDFMITYIPNGKKTTIRTDKIRTATLNAWWLNPRDGTSKFIGQFKNEGTKEFIPTSVGRGSDWLLLIMDSTKKHN